MTLFTVAWKNLLRRRARSLLTAIGIMLAVAGVVTLTAIAWGFEYSWQRAYDARGSDAAIIRSTSENSLPAPFDLAIAAEVRKLSGVQNAAGMLSELLSVADAPPMFVFGWEHGSFLWDHLQLTAGRWPTADERAVVLGALAAEITGKKAGDTVQIDLDDYAVVGVFESAAVVESGAVLMTLSQMQRLTGQAGRANFLSLRLTPGAGEPERSQLRGEIQKRFPGFVVVTSSDLVQQNPVVKIAKAMSWATALIAGLIGAAAVFNTALMSVFERTREIALLLAVGWRRARILQLILIESVLLALVGGVAGLGLGAAQVELLQFSDAIRGKIEGEITAGLLVVTLLMSVSLGLLGGLFPALRASRLKPGEALHQE